MNHDAQLKLQAYRDGELPAAEAAEVQSWLARDAEARALLAELEHTAKALSGNEAELKLPESREFFWSKIEREIQRLEQPATRDPAREISWTVWVRQQFAPLAGLASLAIVLGLLIAHPGGRSSVADSGVIDLALASDDMGAHTFRDQDQRITVVWLDDRTQDSEFTTPEPFASVQPE